MPEARENENLSLWKSEWKEWSQWKGEWQKRSQWEGGWQDWSQWKGDWKKASNDTHQNNREQESPLNATEDRRWLWAYVPERNGTWQLRYAHKVRKFDQKKKDDKKKKDDAKPTLAEFNHARQKILDQCDRAKEAGRTLPGEWKKDGAFHEFRCACRVCNADWERAHYLFQKCPRTGLPR